MGKATTNNQIQEFEEGIAILEASRAVGVEIPRRCDNERLKPIGSCRMCMVMVERGPHPVTACNTSLTDGMVVSTHTLELENERRALLKMLAQDHPGDGLTQTPEKPFYRFIPGSFLSIVGQALVEIGA